MLLQFKQIQFAYEVLSDAQKREMYDRFGIDAVKDGGDGGFPGGELNGPLPLYSTSSPLLSSSTTQGHSLVEGLGMKVVVCFHLSLVEPQVVSSGWGEGHEDVRLNLLEYPLSE